MDYFEHRIINFLQVTRRLIENFPLKITMAYYKAGAKSQLNSQIIKKQEEVKVFTLQN